MKAILVALVLVVAALAVPLFWAPGYLGDGEVIGGPPGGEAPDQTPSFDEPPPPDSYSVHLVVNAEEGPLGPDPQPVDRRLFSTNLWMQNGWWPEVDPVWLGMLKAIEPGMLRWPAGHPGQNTCFDPENDGTPYPGCTGDHIMPAKQLDQFVEVSHAVGAEPLVAINVKTGTPEMAAEIVHYLNVENDYDVKWFHLGNEPDLGDREEGLGEITEAWPRFSTAMREVDPEIKLAGPEIMTGANVMGIHGRQDWIRPFLEANPDDVDAISWHLYPLDSENRDPTSSAHPTVEHLLQWEGENWRVSGIRFIDVANEKLRQDRDELMPGAEIWVTELGPDSGQVGAKGVTDAQVAAVWFADVLGRFGASGTHATFQFAYDHWSAEKDELSLVQRPPWGNYSPLPPWYTYWLYAEHWGNAFVKTESSDDGNVSAFASLREDGKLAVVMVNKQQEPVDARLTIEGFGPVAHAERWELTADAPDSLDATVNGERVNPLNVEESASAITPEDGPASNEGVWDLPAMSVTFAVFEPAEDE